MVPYRYQGCPGSYISTLLFCDVFLQTVDCNTKLSSTQKFRYLKSVLRDDAYNLLNGVNVSDSNYQLAWEKLERRYDKPLYIINSLIEQYLKLPNVSSGDGANLRKLVDKADEVIRGLEAVKAESRDPWLIYMLLNKIDSETRKAWALENDMSEESTIQSLLDFLDKRSSALEASDLRPTRVLKGSRSSNPTNIKSLAVLNASCPKCKGEHYLPQCPEFVEMSVSSRRSFARDQRLCYNCLGTKHSSMRCRVKARCAVCKSRHHSLVHLDNIEQSSNPTSPPIVANPAQSTAPIVSNSMSHNKPRASSSVILPTAVVKVFDVLGRTHLVRVLLDSGSQVSFVTDSLVKRLGLPRSHARLPISGISSVEAGVTQGVVDLSLKSRISSDSLQVQAYVLNKITSPTPSMSFDESNFTFLEDLLLADVGFKTPGPIDVLLGADKAWTILLSGHRSDPDGKVVAHETIFGWVITGCLPGSSFVSLLAGLDLDEILKSFWEIEEVAHSSMNIVEDEVDENFSKTLTRSPDNRYVVDFREINCKESVSIDLDSSSQCTKVLGLVWNPYHDTFSYKVHLTAEFVPIKRNLLSEVAKIFDPLGFLAPSTILLKILFQELWIAKTKIEWDDPLPMEIRQKWMQYREHLNYFEKFRISRRFTRNSNSFELIGFSDASEKAYSAVVYCRSSSDDDVQVRLVAAKTRVAPVKQLSIPRLELCGSLLLCRLLELIRTSLDIQPVHVYAFCDSKIVLCWLSSPPRKWNTFVANRISEILSSLPRASWNHVCSSDSPADCASRGLMPKDLMEHKIWWTGPKWLSQDIEKWPCFPDMELEMENIPEERKQPVNVHISVAIDHFLERLSVNISNWRKLVRVVGYLRRFTVSCRLPKSDRRHGYLSLSELRFAKTTCLKWSQREFSDELNALKTKRCVSKTSKLCSLSPFVDDLGLLRVGGRISNARNVPFNIKHPIILPKNSRITQLVLLDAHRTFLHIGVSGLFVLIRQEYWIVGCRNLIRKLVHDCVTCFRQRKATSTQLMGNLPSSRVNPSFAFAHTGCDYAGPITLRSLRGRKPMLTKGYIALFVCMTTKALHIELVSDLTTDAFLAALKRFIARRGKCSVMYSDNGTNFRGAAHVLSDMFKLVQSQAHNNKVAEFLAADSIEWQFIPPHSPHFGGLWEAGVKLVKQHLRRVIGDSVLTFEEMYTLLAQIEALLNSRPLCASSDSDLDPLTPSHFLIGRPYTAVPEPSYLETPINRLGRWELLQNMMQGFWRRWRTDYLTSLQQRPKWQEATRDFEVGDMVILKEPDLPPSQWNLGRIMTVHPGDDGHVRVVTLRTKRGTFKRPITKISLLPCPEIPSAGAAC